MTADSTSSFKPGGRWRRAWLALACAVATGASPAARAAESEASEAAIQAAYIFNFARFTEWPSTAFPSKSAALNYCQLGKRDALTSAMGSLGDRPIQGHPLRIVQIDRIEDLKTCHLLFVAEPDAKRRGAILQALGSQNTLTISDINGFAREGGMIGLMRVGSRLRFDINRTQTQKVGLRLAADLLSLASAIVETEGAPGR